MSPKLLNTIVLFALFGIAMNFFGNLYEAIGVGPNILINSVQRLQHFQNFFGTTNPAFYYIPVTQLAILASVIGWFVIPRQNAIIKNQLLIGAIFQVLSLALTAYIVPQINFKLFFGDLTKLSATETYNMALLWNILNAVRMLMIATAMVFTFKGYLGLKMGGVKQMQ